MSKESRPARPRLAALLASESLPAITELVPDDFEGDEREHVLRLQRLATPPPAEEPEIRKVYR